MKKAGRAIGRFLGAGLAGTAKAGATGAAAYFGQKMLTQRVDFLQKHPMAGPIGMVALGHIGKKKFPIAGNALVAAGVYGAALAYDLNKMANQPAATSSGTNALVQPDEVRALVSPNEIRGIDVEDDAPSLDTRSAMSL